jgi:hypothetical protein
MNLKEVGGLLIEEDVSTIVDPEHRKRFESLPWKQDPVLPYARSCVVGATGAVGTWVRTAAGCGGAAKGAGHHPPRSFSGSAARRNSLVFRSFYTPLTPESENPWAR